MNQQQLQEDHVYADKLAQDRMEAEETEYMVYIKSHCEAPDYEGYFTESELEDRKCQIMWAEDSSGYGVRCGGKLVKIKDGYKCKSCNQVYFKEENE